MTYENIMKETESKASEYVSGYWPKAVIFGKNVITTILKESGADRDRKITAIFIEYGELIVIECPEEDDPDRISVLMGKR